MGVHSNIGFDKFPKQGTYAGRRTRVCFNYENRELMGTIIRDDTEDPFLTMIQLDDGRVVLATECQYAPFTTTPPVTAVPAKCEQQLKEAVRVIKLLKDPDYCWCGKQTLRDAFSPAVYVPHSFACDLATKFIEGIEATKCVSEPCCECACHAGGALCPTCGCAGTFEPNATLEGSEFPAPAAEQGEG